MSDLKIDKIVHFREGYILLCNHALYFKPISGPTAYQLKADRRQELLGKHHLSFTSASGIKYDMTYEYDGDEFIAARLIYGDYSSRGSDVSADSVAGMNVHLGNGTLQMRKKQDPPYVERAASFLDGRSLLLVRNMIGKPSEALFLGDKDGQYTRIDIKSGVQGGSMLMYKTVDDKEVIFEYGRHAIYDGEMLKEDSQIGTPVAYGLNIDMPAEHHDPFSMATDHLRIVFREQQSKRLRDQSANAPRR